MHTILLLYIPYVWPGLAAARSFFRRVHLLKCWWVPLGSEPRQSSGPKGLLTPSWMWSIQSTGMLQELPRHYAVTTGPSGCRTHSFSPSGGLRMHPRSLPPTLDGAGLINAFRSFADLGPSLKPIRTAKPRILGVPRRGAVRRIQYAGGPEEASRGGRDELLNRWSRVRIPAPAPTQDGSPERASEPSGPGSRESFAVPL